MSAAELKNTLHKLIVETEDINVLVKIKEVFFALKSDKVDWADLISDQEKKMIETGLEQADQGTLISHEQVRNRIDEWIKTKQR